MCLCIDLCGPTCQVFLHHPSVSLLPLASTGSLRRSLSPPLGRTSDVCGGGGGPICPCQQPCVPSGACADLVPQELTDPLPFQPWGSSSSTSRSTTSGCGITPARLTLISGMPPARVVGLPTTAGHVVHGRAIYPCHAAVVVAVNTKIW
jgi:hypothetical protein